MKMWLKKVTSKPLYKIFRKLSRSMGYDLISLPTVKLGIDPYLDMKKFIRTNRPVLFDVGANYGQTIDEFTDIIENSVIHSFEPSPAVFDFLKKKKKSSTNPHLNVWNYGVGSSGKALYLNENEHQNMSSFLDLGKKGWGSITRRTSVPIITIDQFCEDYKIDRIDVLKVDTQGFELEVFKGAQKSMRENKIGLLYFEVTFIEMYKKLPTFGELYDFAIKNGFELIAIYPIKFTNKRAGWTDVLFKHKSYTWI